MFCHQCGKLLPENTYFCPGCGAPKAQTPTARTPKAIALSNIQLTKSKLAVLILCAAMLFILLVLPAMLLYRYHASQKYVYSQEYVYFLEEYDWPSAITNAADVELLLRMSLVGMLICLTAIVIFVLKGKSKSCLFAGIANCAISCIVVLSFGNAISSKYNWKSFPCGPLFYFGCALITAIILYRQYKKATGAVGASQPANW